MGKGAVMGFWRRVKEGAGYGFGGSLGARIGWELGGWIVTWLKRLVIVIGLAVFGAWPKLQGYFSGLVERPIAEKKEVPAKPVKEHVSRNAVDTRAHLPSRNQNLF